MSTSKNKSSKAKSIIKKISAPKEKMSNSDSPFSNEKYSESLKKLNALRMDGENKVIALRNEIRDIILNKQLDKATRSELIKENLAQLKAAKEIAKKNKAEVKAIIKQCEQQEKIDFKIYFDYVKAKTKKEIADAKTFQHDLLLRIKSQYKNSITKLKTSNKDKESLKIDLKAEKISYLAKKNEAKTAYREAIDNAKQNRYNAFMNKYTFSSLLRNDKHSFIEKIRLHYEHYIANFNTYNWIIKNALFVVIILVFIALVAIAASKGDNLLSGDSILTALVQIAPKIFFALGVGGLILLGGTDLSIGRLTGVGVSFTLMILSNQTYADINKITWLNFTGLPAGGKVVMALFISILFCTLFTSFAGFFTAKFKMHPFISTLSVQLISYGFFQIFWSATSSFTPDENIISSLRGPSGIFLVIYAAIAVAIVWFIWNKTKFGKYIYAVGGNQEAATVSGINPFVITLLAFVMAGILYGFGGFVQAVQTGTGNFNSGYGTETDAIAACVIGGISFSGGVGKVSGAVIGAIILGFLTHAFSFIGVNSNLQLLIKGVIILIAVALDCVKYLRKK